jgi:hypothetical protein
MVKNGLVPKYKYKENKGSKQKTTNLIQSPASTGSLSHHISLSSPITGQRSASFPCRRTTPSLSGGMCSAAATTRARAQPPSQSCGRKRALPPPHGCVPCLRHTVAGGSSTAALRTQVDSPLAPLPHGSLLRGGDASPSFLSSARDCSIGRHNRGALTGRQRHNI